MYQYSQSLQKKTEDKLSNVCYRYSSGDEFPLPRGCVEYFVPGELFNSMAHAVRNIIRRVSLFMKLCWLSLPWNKTASSIGRPDNKYWQTSR